jgi:putative flippase GtrA
MATLEADPGVIQKLIQRRGLRQFVKFCIVGASSTAVDFAIFYLLVEVLHIGQYFASRELSLALAVSASFGVAVTNGFLWNSRWTFRQTDPEGTRRRYIQFVATNLVGLGLNLSIILIIARTAPPALVALLSPYLHKDPAAFIGKAVATLIVVFWNFTVNKYWTFRS